MPIYEGDIIHVQTGGIVRHTWAHPDIAIAVAMWISDDFGAAVRRLTRRYMEGRISAAESAAAAAALQAASVPVQPEPTLPAKRPASEIEDAEVAGHIRQKLRFVEEMGKLEIMVDTSSGLFTRLHEAAGAVPASQQLVQTLKTNLITRVGAAAENAQTRALADPVGSSAAVLVDGAVARPSAIQLDLRRSVTVQQVAAGKHLAPRYLTSQTLSKIGLTVGRNWRARGGMSLILTGDEALEYHMDRNEPLPFNGRLADAMETHRVQFSDAYRGALEIAAFENISHDVWLYPRASALAMIEQAIEAYVAADRASGHSSITSHFARAA